MNNGECARCAFSFGGMIYADTVVRYRGRFQTPGMGTQKTLILGVLIETIRAFKATSVRGP